MPAYTISFFGHRDFKEDARLEETLYEILAEILVKQEFVFLVVGRSGNFDRFVSHTIHTQLKAYEQDYMLSLLLPYPTAEFVNNIRGFERYYDNVSISAAAAHAHPKAAYGIRNREMVDESDLVICYVEREYGGAYEAMQYAKRQGKRVINLAQTAPPAPNA